MSMYAGLNWGLYLWLPINTLEYQPRWYSWYLILPFAKVVFTCWFCVAVDPTDVRKLNLLSLIACIVILFVLKAEGLKLHQP